MTGLTDPDLLPYGAGGDFADVLQFYELAMQVDAYAEQADAQFNDLYSPEAWLISNTGVQAVGSGLQSFSPTFTTVLWNTSRWWFSSSGRMQPPLNQSAQEWWLIGTWLPTANASGTPSGSTHITGNFSLSTYDPVTGATEAVQYGPTQGRGQHSAYRSTAESTVMAGEALTFFDMMPILIGTPVPRLVVYPPAAGDTAVRQISAGATMWGIKIGKVVV